MFSKYLSYYFFSLIFLVIFICLTTSIFAKYSFNTSIIPSSNFIWPTPKYHTITSPFGPRKSPTNGASTSHSGIDIGAPEGTDILSISDGYVTYTGFNGAGGYTITVSSEPYTISYCHVNPDFQVSVSEYVSKGQVISKVGPKYVSDVPNNPYKDSSGKNTNGATTGPHLHLTIRKKGTLINPISVLN